MNNVSLSGRITKDPEIRNTPNLARYVLFTLAVDRPFVKDTTDFINCVAWNSNAEYIGNYIKKGYLIEVTGTIQTRSYQTQTGENKYITEVVLDSVKNLTPKPKDETPQPTPPQNQKQQNPQFNPQYQDNDEELPF